MSAKRFNEGKPKLSLVPGSLRAGAAKAFEFGAKKYSAWNWLEGGDKLSAMELCNSMQRHIQAYLDRSEGDEESGLHELFHAAANLGMLLELEERGILVDDRAPQKKQYNNGFKCGTRREDHGGFNSRVDFIPVSRLSASELDLNLVGKIMNVTLDIFEDCLHTRDVVELYRRFRILRDSLRFVHYSRDFPRYREVIKVAQKVLKK